MIEVRAPKGMFRVIDQDLFFPEDKELVEDCSSREKALDLADSHNLGPDKKSLGPRGMLGMFRRVFDDEGKPIDRGSTTK